MQDNRINNILDYNGHRFTHIHTKTVRHSSKIKTKFHQKSMRRGIRLDALCIK